MSRLDSNIFSQPSSDMSIMPHGELNTDLYSPTITRPKTPAIVTPAHLREFGDVSSTRKAIYDSVHSTASQLPDVSNQKHTLRLKDVRWVDDDIRTKRQRKDAILKGETMGRRLAGTWQLLDNESGKVVDQRKQVVANVPHLTEGGTFVINGTEYALKNQQRLRYGVYTRRKDNGEIEAHANVDKASHRYWLNPETGVFYLKAGQANLPLLPLLHEIGNGQSERDLREAWGPEIYAANFAKGDASSLEKLKERFDRKGVGLKTAFENMQVDPTVTRKTLGTPYTRLDYDTIKRITQKLLNVSRHTEDTDDRDHLAFQHFLAPEDMFRERLQKDRAGVRRQLLFKSTWSNNLSRMPSSALQDQIHSAILESGLGQALEEINPGEILDKNTQISRMGEGGIPSYDAVPDEARAVQPSHLGMMDPLRTPESFKAGVDVFLSSNVRKGPNQSIYARFIDPRSGKEVWKNPQELADAVVTFPNSLNRPGKRVPAMQNGRLTWVKKEAVNFVLPPFEYAFSPLGNMVPLKSMVKGQRVAMATRMTTQALPLENGEAPMVQTGVPGSGGTRSFEEEYGKHFGAITAPTGGRVISSTPDQMIVQYDNGKTETHELYNNFPYNRKTGITQTPLVRPGQRFGPGQPIAKSNFTDHTGAAAVGLNARVAYTPWGGLNYEDAIVISEAMAKRLTSQHTYQHDLEVTDKHKMGKRAYVGLFPGKYNRAILDQMDNRGYVQPGTKVNFGDPLILSAQERSNASNKVHRQGAPAYQDSTITWHHHDPGVVTDVIEGKTGPVVLVKSQHPMQVGDKMSGRYGDKGVISSIIPDDHMPHGEDGKPFEVLLNPLGVISRTNPAQWAEAALGKIAAKTGKPFKVEDFDSNVPDRIAWVQGLLAKAGMNPQGTENLTNPVNNTTIPDVYTGHRFFMKLHHTSESKGQGRGGGAYTAEETPAKGGETGAKRIALLDVNALLSHGATEVLRDAGAIRGQRNEDYWLQFMQGFTPRSPRVPLVYDKFINELKASGINVVREGNQTHIMALTDKDVDKLAGNRELEHADTVNFYDGLKPIKGGLFDESLTGGHHGNRWSAIKLNEAMPNPVMEEPIRRVLGLTQKKFEGVMSGEEQLQGQTGPSAIGNALQKINVGREIELARNAMAGTSKSDRDAAVRKLGYLKSAQRLGIHPADWMMTRAPVLPPQFRPVNTMGANNVPLVSDPNFLYKEMFEANKNLKEMKQSLGDEGVGAERLALYHAFKAVTGLGEPITQQSRDKEVKGILKSVFGSSPKFGTIQRKLIASTVDNVGRAVVSPNPDLDMDQVALPEDRAFAVYERFVARRLRRAGMPLGQALHEVREKTPLARKALLSEMEERPVIINRAPVLHRFGIMAFRPTLTKGSTLQVSPQIVKGFGMDFDGDAVQYHVPVDDSARKEALETMLPSRQLLSPADFKTPVHVSGQEYVGGLYHATTHKSKRHVRTFATKKDALAAWHNGEIGVGDSVQVIEDK